MNARQDKFSQFSELLPGYHGKLPWTSKTIATFDHSKILSPAFSTRYRTTLPLDYRLAPWVSQLVSLSIGALICGNEVASTVTLSGNYGHMRQSPGQFTLRDLLWLSCRSSTQSIYYQVSSASMRYLSCPVVKSKHARMLSRLQYQRRACLRWRAAVIPICRQQQLFESKL